MPSAPLFYKPLLDAQARSAPVGDEIVHDVEARQVNFAFVKHPDGEQSIKPTTLGAAALGQSDAKAAVEKTFTGLNDFVKARGGVLDGIKLAVDDAGWIANRTGTTIDKHPEVFDELDLEQAARIGRSWAQQAEEELGSHMEARVTNGTLDVGPNISRILSTLWSGKAPKTTDEDAAVVGVNVGRELERTTSPVPADSELGPLKWLEDATVETLALWPGTAAAVAGAAGMTFDAAAVDKLVAPTRDKVMSQGPTKALAGVLALAGIDTKASAQRADAIKLLQGATLDAVPGSLGAAIAAHHKLPGEKANWVAQRILDSGGNPQNIDGLAAQLREMTSGP